jgi:fucose permease
VAWPSIRDTFGRGQSGLGLILATLAAGYLVSSACSGLVMRALRLGDILALSSLAVILALAGYATTGSWPLFLACAAALGLAGGAIDAALNLFVATRFGPRQLNWLHAFYGLGASLGPLIMTAALAGGWGWRAGVAAIAVALAPLTLLYVATRGAWEAAGGASSAAGDPVAADAPSPATIRGTLARRAVWLQIAAFFTLTGLEATAGQWAFTLLTESRGLGTARPARGSAPSGRPSPWAGSRPAPWSTGWARCA